MCLFAIHECNILISVIIIVHNTAQGIIIIMQQIIVTIQLLLYNKYYTANFTQQTNIMRQRAYEYFEMKLMISCVLFKLKTRYVGKR